MGGTKSTRAHDDVMCCFWNNSSSAHQPDPVSTLQCIMVENLVALEAVSFVKI